LLLFATCSLDLILLDIVNRQRWVMCLHKWPQTLHSYRWSCTSDTPPANGNPDSCLCERNLTQSTASW